MKELDSLIGKNEVKEILKVGDSKAYQIIRELNAELEKKNFRTIRAYVPKKYLLERYGLQKGEAEAC